VYDNGQSWRCRAATLPGGLLMIATRSLGDWLPGLKQLRNYERAWLRGDVIAGLTVTAYLVPQVMAYSTLAGLPAVTGLWAAIVASTVYVIFGSSRQLSMGPESTTALMTAAMLAPLAVGDSVRYGMLAATLAVLVGAVGFIGAISRLGFLANMLSRPVLVGYMTGIAILMIASQLGKITGTPVSGDEFVGLMRSFGHNIEQCHWPTVALASLVLLLLLGLGRWAPRVPGPLIAVLAATMGVVVLSLRPKELKSLAPFPPSGPRLIFRAWRSAMWWR
jgi:SulP family sulfate permease